MKKAKQTIADTHATSPVVMFSGGKDSVLVLHLVRKVYPAVECIWYRTGNEAERKSVEYWTMRLGLTVYSHAPSTAYLLPNALIREFAINDATFPVVVETRVGVECDTQEQMVPNFHYPWSETFTGWKDSDEHELAGGKVPYAADGTVIGGSRFYAPIRHMSDSDVRKHLSMLAPEFEEFDDAVGVPSGLPHAGLAQFQKRFFGLGG